MPRRQPLSPEQIKLAITESRTSAKPIKKPDGESLYLVARRGRGFWVGQAWQAGKVTSHGLGCAGTVTAPAARRAWADRKAQLRNGTAPATRTGGRGGTGGTFPGRPFAVAVSSYISNHAAEWAPKQRARYVALVKRCCKAIDTVPVARITAADVAEVLRPIWKGPGSNSGGKLRGLLEHTFDAERVLDNDLARPNPAQWSVLCNLLSRDVPVREHHASLPWAQVPALYAKLKAEDGRPAEKARVLRFAILTAARKSEAADAQWFEIDLAAKRWRIPADRKKEDSDVHIVPLSDEAIALLGKPSKGRVFEAFGKDSLRQYLRTFKLTDEDGNEITQHGFRASFATWAQEHGFDEDVIKLAIDHTERDQNTAAYLRSIRLDDRRRLMDQWSVFLTGK